MRTIYTLLYLFASVSTVMAQNSINSIEDQFTTVIDKSNSYKEFKVIKKTKLKLLRKNVLDSVRLLETTIGAAQEELEKLQSEMYDLNQNLTATQKGLSESKEKENTLEFFGVQMNKTTYNTMLWSIVSGLIALLLLLFVRHKRSHSITKETNLKLAEVETEFDAHRKKTLTNEQLLRRKLQDEINKNRKA